MKISLGTSVSVLMLAALSANAGTVTLSTGLTAAQFATYQAGKTVQNFENVAGDPGYNISNFNSNVAVTTLTGSGKTLFQTWGAGQTGFISTSGGAAAAGIFNLTGGLTGATSGTHVLAPLSGPPETTCFSAADNCFMAFELIFTQPVNTVGFFMSRSASLVLDSDTSITVDQGTPQIQRSGEVAFFNQAGVAGGYVTLTSSATDINVVSFLMNGGPAFIDDFTYSRGAGVAATPEPVTFGLGALALCAVAFRSVKRRAR